MTYLSDLFSMELFREMQDAGFIKVQRHPDYPNDLAIANYTHKTQEHYHWNDVTEQCRGLIFNPSTYEIVARPMRKFYNYDEARAPKIEGTDRVQAYDKVDGSLGIAYARPDGKVAIATRGSFTSDQAVWATEWVNEDIERRSQFTTMVRPWKGLCTDLFEIIYPENRIVVSYDFSGLMYLGTMDVEKGVFMYAPSGWEGHVMTVPPLYYGNFSGLFKEPERENAEGYVVYANDITGQKMVKVKYEEYVRLHRIVSNLSRKSVWEAMQGPFMNTIDELVRDIPEEHEQWVRKVGNELFGEYMSLAIMVNELNQQTAKLEGRRAKAIYATQESGYPKAVQSAFFSGLDGKPYVSVLWNAVKPKGDE